MEDRLEQSPQRSAGAASPPKPTRPEAIAMGLLGIDWGGRRIGMAVKPAGQDWALPRAVLTVAGEAEAIEGVARAIAETGAQGIVVGLPEHQDPEMGRQVRRFCRKAREKTSGVRWFFIDETLTTQAADSISLESPSRRATDDLAAQLILETFLQSCPAGR